MNAKNGELGIARFDSDNKSKRWEEHICFVTGRNKSETRFVYWDHNTNGTIMSPGELPKGRVVSAAPKPGKELIFLSGEFYKLTIDDVVPATEENMAALCFSVSVDTSKVKLGGCYHTGRAYCLGYRTSHEEIELDNELFTCLEGGFKGGAKTALNECKENFDHTKDIPRFIVELAAVKIIDEDTDVDFCHCGETDDAKEDCECGSHPDDCNCNGKKEELYDLCFDCCNSTENCDCEDAYDIENKCEYCGSYPDDCNCDLVPLQIIDEDDEEVCVDCGEELDPSKGYCDCDEDDDDCIRCGMDPMTCGCWDKGGCMGDDDLDDENVDKTFRPMNPFARARWLKACNR